MKSPLAPIAVFAYKRPDHLRQTLKSLESAHGFASSPLYIFCDGPKVPAEVPLVREVQDIARAYEGKAVVLISERNRGLANSIVSGVDLLTKEHGRAIIVEDDLVVAPGFLDYLNRGLDIYEGRPEVMHISAYMYPIPSCAHRSRAVFLPTIGSWGWATWRRAWSLFEPSPSDWRRALDEPLTRRAFDLDGAADFSSMLRAQMEGRIDSWVIRWYWTTFKSRGYVLYPPKTLVMNKGFDKSGTHGSRYTARVLGSSELPKQEPIEFPDEIELTRDALEEVKVLLHEIFGGPGRRLLRNALSYARHHRKRLLRSREI